MTYWAVYSVTELDNLRTETLLWHGYDLEEATNKAVHWVSTGWIVLREIPVP